MNIRQTFVGAMVVLGVLVLMAVSAGMMAVLRTNAVENHRAAFQEIASREARHLEMVLEEKRKTALTLAETPSLVEAVLSSNAAFDALPPSERMHKIQADNERWIAARVKDGDPFIRGYLSNPTAQTLQRQHDLLPGEYGEIFVTNRHGALVATSRPLTTLAHGGKYWWRQGWNDGLGATFLDDRGWDESVGQPVLGIVVPVRHDGKVVGILKSNLLVETILRPMLLSHERDLSGRLRVVRSGGVVIYEDGKTPLTRSLPPLMVERMSNHHSGVVEVEDGGVLQLTAFVPLNVGRIGTGLLFGGQPHSGDHSQGNGGGEVWYVIVDLPMDQILGRALAMSGELAPWFGGALLLMGLLAWFLVRQLVHPLRKMAKMAEKVSAGDLFQRLPLQDVQELAPMVEAFNRMAESLHQTSQNRDQLLLEATQRQQVEQTLQQVSRRLEDLVNTVEGILWELDVATFRFTFVSQQAEQILGYPLSDWFEQKDFWQEKIHPEDRDWAIRFCMEQTCQLANHTFEYRMIAKDGRNVWLRDVVVVKAEGGNPVTLRGLMVDITELKNAHHSLSMTQFSVDQAPDAVVWINQDAEFIYVNDAHCASLGYTREELLALRVWDVDPNFPREAWPAHWVELEEKKQMRFETLNRTKDGRVFPVEIHLRFQIFNGRKINCAFIRDISLRNKVEEEKQVLEKQLRQAQKLEAIGTLAGGVAHDFNNILGIILGYVELAHEQVSGNIVVREFLEEAERAGMRARDLVLQLLTFSRRTDPNPQPLRLSNMVNEVMKFLRSSVPTTIEFRTEMADAEVRVLSDATQAHQILMNLCTNAVQAMEGKGTLTVRLERRMLNHDEAIPLGLVPGGYAVLGVRDTGKGMPAEVMEHIFDPFFTTKPLGQGTGLGLSVVHGIVTGCKGAVVVESAPQQGSLFQVFLPLISARAHDVVQRRETPPKGEGRILLVDDEPQLLEMAAVLLRELGYQTVTMAHPQKAWEYYQLDPQGFAAVITDLTMPGMTGESLGRLILNLHPDQPIILCTGYADQFTLERALEIGFRGFLQKPFTRRELAVSLQRAIHVRAA